MPIATANLFIDQGATFRQTIACDLSDKGIANIAAWPPTSLSFTLSVGLRGDASFRTICVGTASVLVNNLTLDIDDAVTALIPNDARDGRWVAEVANATDRHRVAEGAWFLRRDNV